MHLDPIYNPLVRTFKEPRIREFAQLHTLPRTGQYSRQARVGGRDPRYRCTSGSTTFGVRYTSSSVFNSYTELGVYTPRSPLSRLGRAVPSLGALLLPVV